MKCKLPCLSWRSAIVAVMAVACLGCSSDKHVAESALGGPYYLLDIRYDGWPFEPGGAEEFHLLRKDPAGKTFVISNHAWRGAAPLFRDGSAWHVYGKNLIYFEQYGLPEGPVPEDQARDYRVRLM